MVVYSTNIFKESKHVQNLLKENKAILKLFFPLTFEDNDVWEFNYDDYDNHDSDEFGQSSD